MNRRKFLGVAGVATASTVVAALALRGSDDPGPLYTEADIEKLAKQWRDEAIQSGQGPFGTLRFRGYRGLAELPWFEIDDAGVLRNVATDLPEAIDMHCHFGISMLMAPDVDLHRRTERVQHLLDCDGTNPGCALDLDIYINGNFTEEDLKALRRGVAASAIWGTLSG